MISEVKYSTFEGVKYAYFQGDYKKAKFYRNWTDCKALNDENIKDSFELDKLKSALKKFYEED